MRFDENRNYKITESELIEIFGCAFRKILLEDEDLFYFRAPERALVPRLAMYLRDQLLDMEVGGVKIDLEYSRSGRHSKDPYDGNSPDGKKHWIFPDLLIHERGSDEYEGEEKHKNNILYCEVKKRSESDNSDGKRVKQQVGKKMYCYGINLYRFTKGKIELTLYVRNYNTGEISSTRYYYNAERNQLLPK